MLWICQVETILKERCFETTNCNIFPQNGINFHCIRWPVHWVAFISL